MCKKIAKSCRLLMISFKLNRIPGVGFIQFQNFFKKKHAHFQKLKLKLHQYGKKP